MARILYTGIVSEIKGSIAGTTFQHNASGRIVKGRSNQKFSSSSLQSSAQADFANVITKWRSLSGFDRTSWNEKAAENPRVDKWGRVKTLSGFQYHAAANRNLLTIGEAYQSSPTPYTAPLAVPAYAVTSTTTTFVINLMGATNFTGYQVLVFASPPTQAFSYNSRPQRRLIVQYTGAYLTTRDILSDYIAVYPLDFADLVTNGKGLIQFFLCTVHIATGLTSQFTCHYHELY